MPRKPLLHPHLVIGLAQPAEQLVVELSGEPMRTQCPYPVEGVDGGSISMLTVRLG